MRVAIEERIHGWMTKVHSLIGHDGISSLGEKARSNTLVVIGCLGVLLTAMGCGGGFNKDSSGAGPVREYLTGDSVSSASR